MSALAQTAQPTNEWTEVLGPTFNWTDAFNGLWMKSVGRNPGSSRVSRSLEILKQWSQLLGNEANSPDFTAEKYSRLLTPKFSFHIWILLRITTIICQFQLAKMQAEPARLLLCNRPDTASQPSVSHFTSSEVADHHTWLTGTAQESLQSQWWRC